MRTPPSNVRPVDTSRNTPSPHYGHYTACDDDKSPSNDTVNSARSDLEELTDMIFRTILYTCTVSLLMIPIYLFFPPIYAAMSGSTLTTLYAILLLKEYVEPLDTLDRFSIR